MPEPRLPKLRAGRLTRGQALLFITLSIPVLFGMLGLVVDVGWAYWRREAAKTAAQAAASAVVAKAGTTAPTAQASTNCPATLDTTKAWQVGCDFAARNGFTNGVSNRTVAIQVGSGATGIPVTGISSTYWVSATVSERIPTLFSWVLGKSAMTVTSRATAASFTTAAGSCLYILDPTGDYSLNASNNAQVTATCGIWDYSNQAHGLYAVGSANVTVTGSGHIEFNGGYYNDNSGSHFSPTPVYAAPSTDPLSGLVTPWTNCLNPANGNTLSTCPATTCQYTGCTGTTTHCDSSQKTWSTWQATPYQFHPGVYCGGINISNGMGAYFAPGMYVINGGGVTLNGSSTYCVGSGSCSAAGGVTFYLTGTNANYQGFVVGNGSTPSLRAPTTGDLSGILVYSDRSITAPTTGISICNSYVPPSYGGLPAGSSSFCGGSNSSLTGILYLPNTTAAFTNGTGSGGAVSLVVKDVLFNGGSNFFSSVSGGMLQSAGGGGSKSYLVE